MTDKNALIAELAGEVLHEIYFNPVFLPDGLYTKLDGKVTQSYTEDAQELFNDLHDVIETTFNSYVLDLDSLSDDVLMYLKDMSERGDDEASKLLQRLDQ